MHSDSHLFSGIDNDVISCNTSTVAIGNHIQGTVDEFFVAQWIKCFPASRATLSFFYHGQEKVFSHR